MDINFKRFFRCAMGKKVTPYPYQEALANEPWPEIVKIPTGLGKTAGIVLSWLFKRFQNDSDTPRRLVYCLPMRVLVEQTAQNARLWVKKLADADIISQNSKPSVHVLMGGETDADWDKYPEKDVIIIGTQDQLLSRALNRGYTVSRFRWPAQFGLLNNDCLWVMDEIQLMGTGLATTAQLQAFRDKPGTALPVRSVWMSATLQKEWLDTVDFARLSENLKELELSKTDKRQASVKKRIQARKPLEKADCKAGNPKKIAEMVLNVHQKGTKTLVIVNTVKRAADIYKKIKSKNPEFDLILVHSRFRPDDRKKALDRLLRNPGTQGTVCISTQVVEAGVDISAVTLITELAAWASMIQRFGRCNRYGLIRNARVIWLDIDLKKKGAGLPYTEKELRDAAAILDKLTDVGPAKLPQVSSEPEHHHVLRRKDMTELFDTTPDLAGMDIDISRFIRESDDHDVHVFWREIPEKENPKNTEPSPSRNELCSVSIRDLKKVKDLKKWRWDHLEKKWENPESIAPGMVIMLPRSEGCYNSETGWTGIKKDIPELPEPGHLTQEGNDDDRYSSTVWQPLTDHNEAVVKEMKSILSACSLPETEWEAVLLLTARWHDAGKTHEVFQSAMVGDPPEADTSVIWAKTGRGAIAYKRRGFRHELASALAMLENGLPDLAAYLAGAHHGKVRLSIRSLPTEKPPGDPNLCFARGVWDGDTLQETDLGGDKMPETVLDLSYMEFGDGPKGASWLARMLALRDDESLGPFRLAYLEALLRAADWRASEKAGRKDG